MLKVLMARLQQGRRTMKYPDGPPPPLPDRFCGLPSIDAGKCPPQCTECAEACPVAAVNVRVTEGQAAPQIDLGRCLFCRICVTKCTRGAINFSRDYRLASRQRQDLLVDGREFKRAAPLAEPARHFFGKSLKLRQISAGGCNACEADVNVLNTVAWDLGRFGIQFVASPRHADGVLITGPVPENMRLAVEKTYQAVPQPKLVIAVGSCAIAGGPYRDHPEVHNGVEGLFPVDLYVPGCPPHPLTILDGLLRLLGRIP
jgi:Ni,Fe-hydrogenase III small subunit/Pyruvate/2-oxoacid:ferredoxin oxidoreductase delta subunit